MTSDEWGKDPGVQMMRKAFGQMELAQGELLKAAGISIWDPRLRRWREVSLVAFERASANAARRGIDLREDQAGALYAQCLARTMMREGIGASAVRAMRRSRGWWRRSSFDPVAVIRPLQNLS
jgi:hypothetical protein